MNDSTEVKLKTYLTESKCKREKLIQEAKSILKVSPRKEFSSVERKKPPVFNGFSKFQKDFNSPLISPEGYSNFLKSLENTPEEKSLSKTQSIKTKANAKLESAYTTRFSKKKITPFELKPYTRLSNYRIQQPVLGDKYKLEPRVFIRTQETKSTRKAPTRSPVKKHLLFPVLTPKQASYNSSNHSFT